MKMPAALLALLLPLQFVALPIGTAFAAGNSSVLPPVDAEGQMAPLKPEQLTDEEDVAFKALPAGSEEATRFLYTRGYLRYCERVVAGSLTPLQLPSLPARRNWNRAHLSANEARDIVDAALGMKLLARMQQPASPGRPA